MKLSDVARIIFMDELFGDNNLQAIFNGIVKLEQENKWLKKKLANEINGVKKTYYKET